MKINPALKEELKRYLRNRLQSSNKRVVITSPYLMGDQDLRKIQEKFPFLREAKIITEVDKSLIGGFIIKFGSKMIDLSLRSELQSLKQRIYGIT
ncbi:hypothetical protein A3F03_05050 [Candidatus Roizmanbacteria bacterium RIFCSPHIGHO2_12_FULL_41_11]|uniref:Uncharacterized protein n=2 Tax=Candidatus Roizmaniibacteriota TaxID=1752723 RepID=A0A1F7JRF4_9BACT|nr:MAG: hypothetical protein A3F03_05050 [Candidatus Roizmanbacteria bacterium RIFCSPHIGHO2_12_FULL_41_11]OGK58199.1 MAG: hypothetical protein A3H86_02780 [Candidatus Roizmanbacteria bacterium RIFCSPLOWO2_02_FULL_41_9]